MNTQSTPKTLAGYIAAVVALAALIIALVTQQGEAQQAEQSLLNQDYRILITDDFEGYQYKAIDGTTVVFYLERMVSPLGDVEWKIDQIAGPWGNSRGLSDPAFSFDTNYAPEFLVTFQEAQRVALWRGSFTQNFSWTAKTLDVRDYVISLLKGGG